jgi:hypothetical protein
VDLPRKRLDEIGGNAGQPITDCRRMNIEESGGLIFNPLTIRTGPIATHRFAATEMIMS